MRKHPEPAALVKSGTYCNFREKIKVIAEIYFHADYMNVYSIREDDPPGETPRLTNLPRGSVAPEISEHSREPVVDFI